MFFEPQLALALLLVGGLVFWMLPRTRPRLRMVWLVVFSAVAVGMAAHPVLVTIAHVAGTVWVASWVLHLYRGRLRLLLWLVALGFVLSPMVTLDLTGPHRLMLTLGVSYVTIKAVAALIDAYDAPAPLSLVRVLLLLLFLPIYSSGPIEVLETFDDDAFRCRFEWTHLAIGARRILIGLFKSYFIATTVLGGLREAYFGDLYSAPERHSAVATVAFLVLNFVTIYFDFAGYTDIAVGSSRLFGLRVRENFRYPFLATNIQDFWNRWHLSLGDFIKDYVYLRLVLITRRPYAPLVFAFVAVGLWHQISPGYLAWGLGHGVALMAYAMVRRRLMAYPPLQSETALRARAATGWAATLVYVSLMSFVANAPSLETAWWVLTT